MPQLGFGQTQKKPVQVAIRNECFMYHARGIRSKLPTAFQPSLAHLHAGDASPQLPLPFPRRAAPRTQKTYGSHIIHEALGGVAVVSPPVAIKAGGGEASPLDAFEAGPGGRPGAARCEFPLRRTAHPVMTDTSDYGTLSDEILNINDDNNCACIHITNKVCYPARSGGIAS